MKNTQSSARSTSVRERQSDIKTYTFFVIGLLVAGFIIAKDINLPKALTISVGVSGLLLVFISAFTNPQFSLLVLAAYLPFSKVMVGRFGASVVGLNSTNLLILVVMLNWIISALNKRERIFNKCVLNPVILLFSCWGLFSVFRARYMYGSYYDMDSFFIEFKRWITPMVVYFIVFNMVRDKKIFKKVMFIIMLTTFVVALMAIRDYIHYGDSGSIEKSRINGVFDQPNMLGAFFVYNMFFFLGFFLYYWRSFKYCLLLIPFLACFRGIMVTFSRGAYIAFAFGAIATTFFKSKILFIVSLCLLLAVLFNPIYMPEGIRARLAATFGGREVISTEVKDISDTSATNRLLVWKGALAMIKDQPLFGFGYGTFPLVIGSYIPQLPNMDAHNTYLIIAAEMGIPALMIFLTILLILIKNAWWLLGHSKDRYFKAFALGALGGIFGLMAANMFGSRLNSQEVSAYFWVYAALIMAAVFMKKKGIIE